MVRLIVVSGLPGTGKTTLSRELTRRLGAVYLRVDAVEVPLRNAGLEVGPLGYEVVHTLARENLALGRDVIVDVVNPLPVTRAPWWDLARDTAARCVVLECVLPDLAEHRRRIEQRRPDLKGWVVPTWRDVKERLYIPWDENRDGPRAVIDTTDFAHALDAALVVVVAD
jgi:predicted kinase